MPSTSAYLLSALVATAAAQGTTPAKTYADCEDVVVFFSRGNDAPYHDDRVSGYISEICSKFEGLNYSCDYIDIVFDATQGGDYCAQVAEGAANGISEITQFNARCPNTKIVINGYSQGGNVAGDVLGGPGGCSEVSTGIDPSSQAGQAISAVTLFGDVRHTADQPYNALDGASKSGWARTGDDLARLNRYSDVLRSYCAVGDPVCAGGDDVSYHLNYFELHSDEASDWIISKVLPLLKQAAASSTSSAVASSTSLVPSSTVASSISSVFATTSGVGPTTNSTTSLHQITSAVNATSAAQPTPYSSSTAVLTLVDTSNNTTQASPGHGWNQTATAYSSQPITTLVTIGASSATAGPSPSTVDQSPAGSPSPAPGSYGSDSNTPTTSPGVSVTQVVTQYTTVCPAESTYTSGGQQQTTTYDYLVTSTRTSTFLTTITLAPASPAYSSEPKQPSQPQQWEHQGHQPHPEHPNHPSHPEQSIVVYTTTAPASTTTTYLSAGQWQTETLTSFMTYTSTLTQHITSTYFTTATREASSSAMAAPYPVNNQTEPAAYNASTPRTTFLSSTLKTIQARPTGYWN
ncbi:hypothetical protein LTR97_011490 [Elasticomyces elasticus]|uniref:Cutinase n=1 Tax=Elasticomyces elasticus TaxID=574655 RepID=A0AAN7VSI3_9PEZI|nr:hypothetical protein LTR97_011490 [Elasticomyces elasticus]